MKPHPTWERIRAGRRPCSSVTVGPLRLVARGDSYTVAMALRVPMYGGVRDVPAKGEQAARKAAIDAARAKLADWAAELDALEHQEVGHG